VPTAISGGELGSGEMEWVWGVKSSWKVWMGVIEKGVILWTLSVLSYEVERRIEGVGSNG
jgi:hypothetical protein